MNLVGKENIEYGNDMSNGVEQIKKQEKAENLWAKMKKCIKIMDRSFGCIIKCHLHQHQALFTQC